MYDCIGESSTQGRDRRSHSARVFKEITCRARGAGRRSYLPITSRDGNDAIGREILENCIEKNFHVSNMKRPVTSYFRKRHGCNFQIENQSKINKSTRWIPWLHRR